MSRTQDSGLWTRGGFTMIKLTVKVGEETRELSFGDEAITFGRQTENKVQIKDRKASRQHAKIEKTDGIWRVVDLESNNGTRLNDEPVTSKPLSKGDRVQIGDSVITVVDLDLPVVAETVVAKPAPVAPAPVPQPVEPPAVAAEVPLEKKMEVKKKIERIQARGEMSEKAQVGLLLKIGGIAACVVVAIVLIISVSNRSEQPRPEQVNKAKVDKDQQKKDLKEDAEEALSNSKLAAETGEADIENLRKLAEKHDAYLPRNDNFSTLIARLEAKLPPRRDPGNFESEFAASRSRIGAALRDRRYGEAMKLIAGLAAGADDAQMKQVHEILWEADRDIYNDLQAVIMAGIVLESREEYEKAKQVYAEAAPRFQGTKHYQYLVSKPGDLDLLVRAKHTKKNDPVAKKEEPKKEEPKKEEPVAKVDTSVLLKKLVDAINAGAFKEAKLKLSETASGEPASADDTGIKLKEGGEVAWADIEAKALFNLFGQLKYEGDELLVLAEWAHDRNLDAEANKTLNRYIAGKPDRKEKAFATIARWRGESVPPGGYAFNPKTGQFEDPVVGEVAKLGKELATATDLKKMDVLVGKILEYYNNPNLKAETRESVKQVALDALKANKKKRLDSVAQKAKAAVGFEKLRQLKVELNKRREAAIKVIYDPKIYLPENHPDWRKGDKINGQEEVDRLVEQVRQLWEEGGRFAASLDPQLKRDLESVQEINTKFLKEFGEEPSEDDLKDYDEIMNNLNARIDLKNFALDSKERQLWEWNRWVDKYNEALNDPAVGKQEKEHFKTLNDYREMMGRRRLFIDAKLCRATNKHSAAQDREGRIWHEGPDGTPQSRAQAEGFTAGVGENVCIGYAHPETWTRGWYRASDHHRNGLSEAWNCGGYGYVGRVGSENFSNIAAPKGK